MPQRGGGDSDLCNSGPADSCVLAGRLKLDLRGAFGGGGNSLRPIFTGLVFSAMVKWSSTVPVDLGVLAPDLGFDNATFTAALKRVMYQSIISSKRGSPRHLTTLLYI
jgi:hypothetical protein